MVQTENQAQLHFSPLSAFKKSCILWENLKQMFKLPLHSLHHFIPRNFGPPNIDWIPMTVLALLGLTMFSIEAALGTQVKSFLSDISMLNSSLYRFGIFNSIITMRSLRQHFKSQTSQTFWNYHCHLYPCRLLSDELSDRMSSMSGSPFSIKSTPLKTDNLIMSCTVCSSSHIF